MKSRMLCRSAVLSNSSMFVASIVNIKTIDKDVLDSEWALTSCALRLVCICQQIRMCASCMTNPKSVNDYFIPTTQG